MSLHLDAEALYFVGGFVQAGGVDDVQRHAFDLQMGAHHIARGASYRRHNRQVFTGQGIEQRRLTHIGLADQHNG